MCEVYDSLEDAAALRLGRPPQLVLPPPTPSEPPASSSSSSRTAAHEPPTRAQPTQHEPSAAAEHHLPAGGDESTEDFLQRLKYIITGQQQQQQQQPSPSTQGSAQPRTAPTAPTAAAVAAQADRAQPPRATAAAVTQRGEAGGAKGQVAAKRVRWGGDDVPAATAPRSILKVKNYVASAAAPEVPAADIAAAQREAAERAAVMHLEAWEEEKVGGPAPPVRRRAESAQPRRATPAAERAAEAREAPPVQLGSYAVNAAATAARLQRQQQWRADEERRQVQRTTAAAAAAAAAAPTPRPLSTAPRPMASAAASTDTHHSHSHTVTYTTTTARWAGAATAPAPTQVQWAVRDATVPAPHATGPQCGGSSRQARAAGPSRLLGPPLKWAGACARASPCRHSLCTCDLWLTCRNGKKNCCALLQTHLRRRRWLSCWRRTSPGGASLCGAWWLGF